jgi:hypothetical protein
LRLEIVTLEFQMSYLKSIAVGLAGALVSIVIIGAGVFARAFWLFRKYPRPEGGDWGIDLVSAFENAPYRWLIVLFCFGVSFIWEFRRVSA